MSEHIKAIYIRSMLLVLISNTILNAVEPFTAGTGTANDPYQIETIEQLLAIGQDHDLQSQCYILMSDLELDPNLPGRAILNEPIIAPGESLFFDAFTGVFNGNNHTIRNLVIHSEANGHTGLFGSNRGLIRNLRLEDCDIRGERNVGILVGYNNGVLKNCFASGLVKGTNVVGGLAGQNDGLITHCSTHVSVVGDQNDIGGLVGQTGGRGGRNPGIIEACDSRSTVNGSTSVGGLVGYDNFGGVILECTSLCDVTGQENVGGLTGTEEGSVIRSRAESTVSGRTRVGGMVGQMTQYFQTCLESFSVSSVYSEEIGGGLIGSMDEGFYMPISDCYYIGQVQGSTAGGFIGALRQDRRHYLNGAAELLTDCYTSATVSGYTSSGNSAILGGFVGHLDYNSPWRLPFYSCLWDTDISGQALSVGLTTNSFDPDIPVKTLDITGKTMAQMTDPNTFIKAGWNFEGTWLQLTEQDTPSLAWEQNPCE